MRKTDPERGYGMRKTGIILLAVILLAAAFLPDAVRAEDVEALKPYSGETGYTYVTFGRYPQTITGGSPDDPANTARWRKEYRDWETAKRKELKLKRHDPLDPYDPGPIEKEPILWRVMSLDEEKIYLMSEYILFASPMHMDLKEYSKLGDAFELTELGRKLNGEFAEAAFTDGEMEALVPFGTMGKVCVPSYKDLDNADMGITKKKLKTRKAMATEYAIRSTGAFVYSARDGSHTPYWLREHAESVANHARSTKRDGGLGHIGSANVDVGARPVIQLAADRFRITGGNGTKEDPYTLEATGNNSL